MNENDLVKQLMMMQQPVPMRSTNMFGGDVPPMPQPQAQPTMQEALASLPVTGFQQTVKAPMTDSLYNKLIQRQTAGLEQQREGIQSIQDRIEKMRNAPTKMDITPLLAASDALTGSNLLAAYKRPQSKEEREKELLGYEAQLQKYKGDLTQDEINLLKSQYQHAMGKEKYEMQKQLLGMGPKAFKPGETALDKAFAKSYEEYIASGGYADVEKGMAQLQKASDALGTYDESGNYVEPNVNITGPGLSMVPDFLRRRGAQQSSDIQQTVEEVVQRNLRVVLGAQFTEKEGERLIARAYDPALPEKINKERVDRLLNQMREAAEAKERASKYFETYGTLKGFKGTLYKSANDFLSDVKPSKKSGGSKRAQELRKKFGYE